MFHPTRIPGYWKRARFEYGQFLHQVQTRRASRVRERWLREFESTTTDVIVGANFVDFGGCRHHMHGIRKFSALKVELAPSEGSLRRTRGGWSDPAFLESFYRTATNRGVRAVHTHVFPWLVEWCRSQQGRNFRWVHTHHLWYYPEHCSEGNPLEPWHEDLNQTFLNALQHCDIGLAVSKWQRDFLAREHGLKATYLPNAVDVPLCERGNELRFRRRFQIEEDFILWVGRNDPVKDPASFVRLAEEMPDKRFIMVGPDLSSNSILSDWNLTPTANLTFLGRLSQAEVQDAIAASSALVVTSFREGLPTLVLEAMAQARPIVALEEEGSAEALGHGDFGFLTPRDELSALAETVEKAERDSKKPRLARERALSEYDWRVVAPKLDAIYQGATL